MNSKSSLNVFKLPAPLLFYCTIQRLLLLLPMLCVSILWNSQRCNRAAGDNALSKINYVCRPHVQSPAQLLLGGAPAFIFCVVLRAAPHATYFYHNRFIILFNTPCRCALDFLIQKYLGNVSIFHSLCYFLINIYSVFFPLYQKRTCLFVLVL